MTIWTYLGAYLLLGIIALVLLDLLTGRIRRRFKNASAKAQEKLIIQGAYVGNKQVIVITALAILVFWPFAIYGAIRG